MRYRDALAFLDSLVNYEKLAKPRSEFKLDNILRLLRLARDPQRRLRNVVLVAGTKGKGSVSHMLEAALRGCGLSTGLFVSPHVSDVRERIQLSGRPISERAFSDLVCRLWPLVRRQPVSYFELTAAMAFELFSRRQPDYPIIEVGLGGRLDAANLCDPAVSVITRIGFDHMNVLGRTLTRIAREKAGVMRPGRPVVIGSQARQAMSELRRSARRVRALPVLADRAVRISDLQLLRDGVTFDADCRLGRAEVKLPLLGMHQVENCRIALAVLGLLAEADPRITFSGVRRGLRRVVIPARCQLISERPLVIVDSCHNPESGRALARVIRDHVGRKVILVYGSLAGKLVEKTVRPLARWVERAVLVQPDSPRAMELRELERIFTSLRISHTSAHSVAYALFLARDPTSVVRIPQKPIVVAGSFYLAGDALRLVDRMLSWERAS